MSALPGDVTGLLLKWRGGDERALDRLIPLVHGQLHRIADRCIRRERADHTLQATALVNETYLLLVDAKRIEWRDRAHFLAIAARLMRRVLVDHARARGYQKRGGGAVKVTLVEDVAVTAGPDLELIALDAALDELARLDERKSRVIELRCFGGLSVKETAAVLGVSQETVMRDWKFAKAWLLRELAGGRAERRSRRTRA
jgi:RNA polymerase sigma factor (TIGR02999 family)